MVTRSARRRSSSDVRHRPPCRAIGATWTSGSALENAEPPTPSPRPAEKNAAQVPSDDTIGAPSGFCGLHSVPYAVQSSGVLSPVRIAPAMQAGCSLVVDVAHVELAPRRRSARTPAAAGSPDIGISPIAAPLARAHLEHGQHLLLGERDALAGHGAGVLVLDLVPALLELADRHPDALEQVERLEAGDDDRHAVLGGDRLVLGPAHDRADVAGGQEPLDLVGRASPGAPSSPAAPARARPGR